MTIEYGKHLLRDILFPPKEPARLEMDITPEASNKLSLLLQRPNPYLSEFPFLGLGREGLLEDIMVVDHENYSQNSFLHWRGGAVYTSNVDRKELQMLFNKLYDKQQMDEFLVFGHMHPTGTFQQGGVFFTIPKSDALLTPSGGSRLERGIQNRGDLAAYSTLVKENPHFNLPYVGIAAETQNGPSLRVYQTDELLKIKWWSQIDRVPQRTFVLV